MTFPRGSTSSSHAIKAGDLIGNYRIDDTLSAGGMGTVHRATHVILQRRAAIKILHADLLMAPSAIERLMQEARILDNMNHPAFVEVFDAGQLDDGRPWVAMELIEGRTLAEHAADGAMELPEVARIVVQVCEALMRAHGLQIIHRDVKPENILLAPCDGPAEFTIKLIDWGIAQTPTSQRMTQVDLVPGTPHYLAPELLRGEPATSAVDTYSLGVVAYEILVGEPPFSGDTPIDIAYGHLHDVPCLLRAARPDLPIWLEQLLAAMMDKQPCNRPLLPVVQAALMAVAHAHASQPHGAIATVPASRSATGNPSLSVTPKPLSKTRANSVELDDDLAPIISIERDEGGYYYDELAVA